MVTYTNQYYNGKGPGYFAQRSDQSPLAGHGDSGGPSYSYVDPYDITGYGLIDQGHYASTYCVGVATGTCYYDVFFANERDAESALNASILT